MGTGELSPEACLTKYNNDCYNLLYRISAYPAGSRLCVPLFSQANYSRGEFGQFRRAFKVFFSANFIPTVIDNECGCERGATHGPPPASCTGRRCRPTSSEKFAPYGTAAADKISMVWALRVRVISRRRCWHSRHGGAWKFIRAHLHQWHASR